MKSGTGKSVLAALAILALSGTLASAAVPVKLSGSIAGIVRDNAGIPQMGATVLLFNRYERMIQKSLTNDRGIFGFEGLNPDSYSVRVSLASFMPAMKHQITVQPGMQSLLYINLASMISSVELVYAAPGQGALMSDDWKWALKTATSTRPILRILPTVSISDPNASQTTSGAIFSDTRGILRLSAGESDGSTDMMAEPDLGTAFALATSLFGHSKLQVSGDIGHTARSSLPAASFRTSYSQEGFGPEVAITVHQIYLPGRLGAIGQQDGLPALRTMSVATVDRQQLTDKLLLEYGISLDSVSFIDHLNYFSPFARATYDLGKWGRLKAAYSSGAPPVELLSQGTGAASETEPDLHQNLNTLAMTPGVSIRDSRAEVQRTQSFEVGYEKKLGSRIVGVHAYREIVSNGALTMFAADDLFPAGDVLPSLSSNSGVFDVGNFQTYGYSASIKQSLGDKVEITAASGREGVLMADSSPLANLSGDEIRSRIHTGQRYWASVRFSSTLPKSGTQIQTSYQWMDYGAILPARINLTDDASQEVGWNMHIRQPLPFFPGVPGRIEITGDLRNMLAQGYVPLSNGDGRNLLMQSPRVFRGGVSFIF
jgi:hypothetical protein